MSLAAIYNVAIAGGVMALLYALFQFSQVHKAEVGTAKMVAIAEAIQVGAMAFIKREYRLIAVFVLLIVILLGTFQAGAVRLIGMAFIAGAVSSGLAGFIGLRTATIANVRTANAARESLGKALNIAFAGGSVMGLSVVGLGVLGITMTFWYFSSKFGTSPEALRSTVLPILSGFSFGASSIALFSRVGGGIYTKAADVGADLVGKIEKGIPEDDPRNPAVIADNVGDNVGDVCGMGADLFESYVGVIIAAMILAASGGIIGVMLPLVIAAVGIFCSILGTLFVKTKEGGNPQVALNKGSIIAGILFIAASYFAINGVVTEPLIISGQTMTPLNLWYTVISGLIVGIAIGLVTEYYCSSNKGPVNEIVASTTTGAATTILAGLGVGMRSTTIPVLLVSIDIIISYHFCGFYGVALAGLGMLATLGIQLAVDAYGPIADNAGGISQMAGLGDDVRSRTDRLDAVGNTTAAIGKGFAIGSAALTALALFGAFREQTGLTVIDITDPATMGGLMIGAMLPFLFSAMAMKAVWVSAMLMVEEVRRQFRDIPGLMEGTGKPEYAHCVDIATASALKQMLKPGLLAVVAPVAIGFLSKHFFGTVAPLGGFLAGATASGVVLAIFLSNTGGAWDNAKKQIEGEIRDMVKGTGKGSERHAAAVIGDTVGDPFKDTAGPSLNILIKVMSILALVLAPLFV